MPGDRRVKPVLKDAQAKAAEKGESPACFDQASGDAKPSTSTAGFLQQLQSSAHSTTASKGMVQRSSDGGDHGQGDGNETSSRVLLSTDGSSGKTGMLLEYMLCKYKVQQPIRKAEMLKVINKRFKEYFPDILKKVL
ncbi:Melanoma-associated antigen B4 [Cricetulus griseus]|uniref:Melanoma-associated antigen B4 n=1 Tax=Cricetulus griseus TaxID=10029 RepID=G3HXG7_CRIGR|nr:Melanoma-associated antigen B4 [Cricetulus griseus]ERE65056.1 melanoma-associated antigen B4-like protein [Cricetulus griseus]